MWLVKTDRNGVTQWDQTYGGSYANSIIQTATGGFVLAGGIYNPAGGCLVKTDAHGTVEWTRTYGSSGVKGARVVIQMNDEGFVLVGYTIS